MKKNRAFAKAGTGFVLALVLALAGCASKSPAPLAERGGKASAAGDTYTVKPGDTLYSIAREHGMDHRDLIVMNGIDNPNRITPGRILKVKPPATATSSVASTAPITSDVVVSRPIDGELVVQKPPPGVGSDTLKREPKAGKEPYSDQALALAQTQGQAKAVEPLLPVAPKPEVQAESKPAEAAASGEEAILIWPASGKTIGNFGEGGNKGVDIAGKSGDPVIAAGDGKVLVANNFVDNSLRGYGNMVVIKNSSTLITVYAHNSKLLVKDGQTVTKGQKIAEMGNTGTDQVKLHFEVRRQGKPVDPLKYLPPR